MSDIGDRADALIDNVLRLSNLVRLMEFVDAEGCQELRQKYQPKIEATMDFSLNRFREGNIILACELQLMVIPAEERSRLAVEIAHLLKATCWNEGERIECALTWARHRIESRDMSEEELVGVVPLWPTDQAAIRFGLMLFENHAFRERARNSSGEAGGL